MLNNYFNISQRVYLTHYLTTPKNVKLSEIIARNKPGL